MSEPSLNELYHTVTRMDSNLNKMVDFVYGDLSNPENSYIFRNDKRMDKMETKIDVLITEKNKRDKRNSAISITAIGGAIIALIKSFWQNLTTINGG